MVDLEHSAIGIDTAGDLIRTIDLCGVSPLVRLTSNDPDQIKRVMDAGAHGIVVPMVNTSAEAARAVAATRYAPAGFRGVGLARAQGYGVNFQDYLKWQSDGPVVIVQIEHKDAIDHLDEILTAPGVDGAATAIIDPVRGLAGGPAHLAGLSAAHTIGDATGRAGAETADAGAGGVESSDGWACMG